MKIPAIVGDFLVLVGALAGAVAGFFATAWLFHQGFYAMMLPGGLAGLCAGIFRSRFLPIHILCGLLALTAGILAEWSLFPFVADASLSYFVVHLAQLKPLTMLMIGAGAAIGFWVPFSRGRDGRGSQRGFPVGESQGDRPSGH
jgi:hypothetical protein